jgi:hypothetical protein
VTDTPHFPTQQKPVAAAQSLETVHVVLHALAPHAYGAQALTVPGLHVPDPLHVAAVVWLPAEHDAGVQMVPEGQFRHAPALHIPSRPHADIGVAMQRFRGSGLASMALAHVPSTPPVRAAVQAWHALAHAVSQQTPSTQLPVTH